MKLTDKESESIESTSTSEIPSMQCHRHVMNMLHVADVDSLEQIYDSPTVHVAPNDAESATITFDTGVAQGSITSPQLLNIFINALLWMLTATGQNQVISHGLQIGKDQDDSSQDADHGYHLDDTGFHRRHLDFC